MEIKSTEQASQITYYQKISNSWNIILDFIDLNTIFQYELACKYFRERLLFYYESKQNLLKRIASTNESNESNLSEEEKKNKIIEFKSKFLSYYYNLFLNINISNIKFGFNEEPKEKEKKEKDEIILKTGYNNIESKILKNRIQIGQILFKENKFFILYNDNTFSIFNFDIKNNTNKFHEIFKYDFNNIIINKFKYFEHLDETFIFFIERENSTKFYYLNLNDEEKSMKMLDLKNDNENFIEMENISIKDIFFLNEFMLFLTNNDEFLLFTHDMLKIFGKKNSDSENSENDEEQSDNEEKNNNQINEAILYPQKLNNNYGTIKHIYSNNKNIILLNNEFQIYSIPQSDIKNYKNEIPKLKLFSEQKFPNFYTMNFSKNSFILLEKETIKPLKEWNTEEVYKWFEEMELDDYLNIIKNQKIAGKNIVKGGKKLFLDFMGLEEDHVNKLNYEIDALKYKNCKNMKLWVWGNNKNGQLGLLNNQTFVKIPTRINLPNMIPDDTIEKIFCENNYSILLTKFGNIYITGNYTIKENKKQNEKNNNNNKVNNKKTKGKNKEKNKKNEKNKEKERHNEDENGANVTDNKWINISQNICYNSYIKTVNNDNKNSYFKVKDIFCFNDNIYFIGFYSNKTPFFAVQRKPKFKHLKKGGKFISSDKVIEHIQKFLEDKICNFKIIYGDPLLKMLEVSLPDYLESEVPFHKIIQIKENNEVIWDRKKRYFKENFINNNINKIDI